MEKLDKICNVNFQFPSSQKPHKISRSFVERNASKKDSSIPDYISFREKDSIIEENESKIQFRKIKNFFIMKSIHDKKVSKLLNKSPGKI